uniref:Nudix hydrolase domain-containing protein n=2 Tax=Macrostomum lignano TaxID=282301 RepID=A0A1I8IIF0_9PLAT
MHRCHLFEGANRLRCIEALQKQAQRLPHPVSVPASADHRQASVLVPFCVLKDVGPGLLYTVRSGQLRSHSGQVSFPGGVRELNSTGRDCDFDLELSWAAATALREAEEEIGLSAGRVDVWGAHRSHTTSAKFAVTPVIGYCGELASLSELRANPDEVSLVLFRSLEHLLDKPGAWGYTVFDRPGYGRYAVPVLRDQLPRIWGLTAVFTFVALQLLLGPEFPQRLNRMQIEGEAVLKKSKPLVGS